MTDLAVLVVDDEQPVLDGIEAIVEKRVKGCSIAAKARSGSEALEFLSRNHADIMLVDIQMPGIDGIELIKRVQASGKNPIVILITAFERFDIAKAAVGLGVFEYLLKPVNPKILGETIERAGEELEKRTASLVPAENTALHEIVYESLLQSMLLHQNIEGKLQQIHEINDTFNPPWRLVRLRTAYTGSEVKIIQHKIRYYLPLLTASNTPGALWLLLPSEYEYSNEKLRMALSKTHQFLPEETTAPQVEEKDIDSALIEDFDYHAALFALERHFLEADLENAVSVSSEELQQKRREVIERYLSFGAEKTEKLLHELMVLSDHHFESRISALWFAWLSVMLEMKLDQITKDNEIHHCLNELSENSSLLDIAIQSLRRVSSELFSENQVSRPIKSSLNYINEHFSEAITLEIVAEFANVTAQYLSRQFAKEMGASFIDYLTNIRIEHAKTLLRSGRHTIGDISIACGYFDPNYFGRVFKKQTGMSPSQYMEKYLGL
jgi:two-component system response regulator YesN